MKFPVSFSRKRNHSSSSFICSTFLLNSYPSSWWTWNEFSPSTTTNFQSKYYNFESKITIFSCIWRIYCSQNSTSIPLAIATLPRCNLNLDYIQLNIKTTLKNNKNNITMCIASYYFAVVWHIKRSSNLIATDFCKIIK